jgi:DNA-binding SARP family transcriptional activator/pimeloyl-ACP methyl ester carboxylesterase
MLRSAVQKRCCRWQLAGWEVPVEFRILGSIEMTAGGQPLDLGGARTRSVLAMLLVHANEVVPKDQLIDELWPGQPAESAAASLQVRISELRKVLRLAGEADRLVTRPPGYLLRVKPGELDADVAADLAAAGQDALAAGDATAAIRSFDKALRLWHGRALADMDAVPCAVVEAARLAETRLAILESRAEAALNCGRHRDLVAELETVTAANPLRERLWYLRMLALYRSDRQADALRAYANVRAILVSELGIEPGPQLRDLHARILQQDPDLAQLAAGRETAETGTAVDSQAPPQVRYVRSDDDVHIAYQVLGSGNRDIVFVPGLMSHLELAWEDRETADFFRRLATMGRLILFDKRDTGLSDRAVGDASLEERMSDVLAVMRAAGSERAVLFGYSEGAPMSILFAATYPERVTSLILGSAAARWFPAPDYPCGADTVAMFEALTAIATNRWGQGDTIDWYLPSRAGSAAARELFARFERMAISPSAFLRMTRMIAEIDVRAALPAIRVPTLVLQRLDDRITPPFHGRYLAARIPGARYFEQPGDHSLRFAGSGDNYALCQAIEEFLAGQPEPPEAEAGAPERVLSTVLVADVAPGPVATATALTDAPRPATTLPGPDGLGQLCDIAIQQTRRQRGRLIRSDGTGILATFDVPGRAIRCAAAVRDAAAGCGLQFRAGIHTGEVDLVADGVDGVSVEHARDIAALAQWAEILVSRTVKDLVAGSGIEFADRGSHDLGGQSDARPLYAVGRL